MKITSGSEVRTPRGFNLVVLRTIQFLGLRACGTEIRGHLARQLEDDELPGPKVYLALTRLEHQGLIVAKDQVENPVARRGRPRRFYELTAPGLRALKAGVKLYAPVTADSGESHGVENGEGTKVPMG